MYVCIQCCTVCSSFKGGYENFTPLLGSHCPPNRIPISGDQIPGVIGGRAFARVGCGAVMGSGLGAA